MSIEDRRVGAGGNPPKFYAMGQGRLWDSVAYL